MLPLSRKLLLATILTGVTLALALGSLELGLRIVGYGYSPHFARRAAHPDGTSGWRENRWATAPFFTPALVRRPQPFRLTDRKAAGTYRIFVLGSSAAMGDPEASFSVARMLEKMLGAAYPGVRFEVVNAAVTAINSHLVRGIAEDCAQLEPDLFIVYEGHNEVIGPFGPAGVFMPFLRSPAVVRAAVWLKGTRTGQWVSALASGREARKDWGGMQMFLRQAIAGDDPRLTWVRKHFRSNLLAIAAQARAAGARTIACTVLTNDRDFAPFLSAHKPALTADELVRWQTHFDAAQAAQRTGDFTAAAAGYESALALDDRYAELVYRFGRLRLQVGQEADARRLLQRARDLDVLRFRTDSALNDVVRHLNEAGDSSIEVVDLAADLAARSAHGLVGDDLLYEHVHLTFRGAYAVAGALFDRVTADLVRRQRVPAPQAVPFDEEAARVRLGYTTHEQAMIALELIKRFQAPPFTRQIDHAFRLQSWERRAEAAHALLQRPEALPALRQLYAQALERSPDDWILARNAGAMAVARSSPAEALPLLLRASGWIDDDVDTLVPLGWAHRALGHPADARATFARVRALEPGYPGLPQE